MKKILSVLVVAAIFASCKKETMTNPGKPSPAGKRLTQLSWDGSSPGSQRFSYDNENRLIKAEDDESITTFVYNGNTVVIKEFRIAENRFVGEINGQLDNNGRVITYTGNFSYHINLPYTDHGTLEYNAEGYLVKLTRDMNYGTVIVFEKTITNGDLTMSRYYENGVLQYSKTMEFYTDKANLVNIDYVEIGSGYTDGLFGKLDKHLLKSAQLQRPGMPNPAWTFSRNYELDNEGYPVSAQYSGDTWMHKNSYIFQ